MTKPDNKRQRKDEWSPFDMARGRFTHLPTGIAFWMFPEWHGRLDVHPARAQPRAWDDVDLGELGQWKYMARARLPNDTPDRRPAGFPGPGDANARGLGEWPVLAAAERLQAVLDEYTLRHGPATARDMLEALGRDAANAWIFRARLDRNRTDSTRAT